jgi:hypothetical protein
MDQLREYFDRVVPTVYKDNVALIESEKVRVIASMERLVAIQCVIILEKEATWDVASSNMLVASDHQRYSAGAWRNTATNQVIYSHDPPESPFHWKKENDGWKNKLTKSVVQSERILDLER